MRLVNIKRIIVIGCGGTGSMLIMPLCRYLKSQPDFRGDIVFIDGDKYEASNDNRQNFHPNYINTNKAEFQHKSVISNIPKLNGMISFIDRFINESDVEDIIGENTVVFNCADNNAIRKFVEDRVQKLENACHICCGNEMHSGQVQISLRVNSKQITPSIYSLHPEFNSTKDDRSKMSCEDLSSLPSGGQLVFANLTCASIALGLFYQMITNTYDSWKHDHIYFNLAYNSYNNA